MTVVADAAEAIQTPDKTSARLVHPAVIPPDVVAAPPDVPVPPDEVVPFVPFPAVPFPPAAVALAACLLKIAICEEI